MIFLQDYKKSTNNKNHEQKNTENLVNYSNKKPLTSSIKNYKPWLKHYHFNVQKSFMRSNNYQDLCINFHLKLLNLIRERD